MLAVIFGYRKDCRSLRERILFGVFVGNIIYSVVNTIPISLEETGDNDCGNPVHGDAQAAVRGLWFWGKFTMISYEFFVIYASVIALKTGSTNLSRRHEHAIHAACIAVGFFAFIGFYVSANVTYQDFLKTSTMPSDISLARPFASLASTTAVPHVTGCMPHAALADWRILSALLRPNGGLQATMGPSRTSSTSTTTWSRRSPGSGSASSASWSRSGATSASCSTAG